VENGTTGELADNAKIHFWWKLVQSTQIKYYIIIENIQFRPHEC